MYATDLRDQLFAAALPLKPRVVWCGSACSVTVAVPPAPAIEGLAISSVRIELSLPTGEVISAPAVQTAGTPLWTATFAAGNFATAGSTTQGFTVYLGGKDETGADRVWIVAKGDLDVRAGDAAPSPGGSYYIVKLRDSAPANPVAGDAYLSGGKLHIYSGTAWTTIGAEPSDNDPLMDGGASAGESDAYARSDHRHPSDTAKLDISAVYPEWTSSPVEPYQGGEIVSHLGRIWQLVDEYAGTNSEPGTSEEWVDVLLQYLFDLKQDALSSAQLAAVNSGVTAASVARWDAYSAQIAAKANSADVNAALAQKASLTDLPYAMVTPGEWEFSDGETHTISVVEYDPGGQNPWGIVADGTSPLDNVSWFQTKAEADAALSVMKSCSFGAAVTVTATRPSLPGHLLDRSGNRVVVSGDTTLTLPAAVPGYNRDFLVRLEISGSTVPTITFAAPTGETITYETDGDEFPVPDEAGTWSYSFTENCVAHRFAVSLKKVNTVAQGGA